MARQPRGVFAGLAHVVAQRGHNGSAVVQDDTDRQALLAALRDAARSERVAVNAWALGEGELRLVATPPEAAALSRMMQAVGRRHAVAFNRRHGRSGALFDGRFRVAVLEPGASTLAALRFVDAGLGPAAASSAPHRLGQRRDPLVSDPPEVWQLGNTPFEREAAWRSWLEGGVPASEAEALQAALRGGWAYGSPAFARALEASSAPRALTPRARGRPRKA